MPQWGKGVQGWVNGWVNVNKEHVKLSVTDEHRHSSQSQSQSQQSHGHSQSTPNNEKAEVPGSISTLIHSPVRSGGPMHGYHLHPSYHPQRPLSSLPVGEGGDAFMTNLLPAPVVGDGRAILDQRNKALSTSSSSSPPPPYNTSPSSHRMVSMTKPRSSHGHSHGHHPYSTAASSNSSLTPNPYTSSSFSHHHKMSHHKGQGQGLAAQPKGAMAAKGDIPDQRAGSFATVDTSDTTVTSNFSMASNFKMGKNGSAGQDVPSASRSIMVTGSKLNPNLNQNQQQTNNNNIHPQQSMSTPNKVSPSVAAMGSTSPIMNSPQIQKSFKRGGGRLKKTNSQSDLLKERKAEKQSSKRFEQQDEVYTEAYHPDNPTSLSFPHLQRKQKEPGNVQQQRGSDTSGSLTILHANNISGGGTSSSVNDTTQSSKSSSVAAAIADEPTGLARNAQQRSGPMPTLAQGPSDNDRTDNGTPTVSHHQVLSVQNQTQNLNSNLNQQHAQNHNPNHLQQPFLQVPPTNTHNNTNINNNNTNTNSPYPASHGGPQHQLFHHPSSAIGPSPYLTLHHPSMAVTTGQYINEAAFSNQHQHKMQRKASRASIANNTNNNNNNNNNNSGSNQLPTVSTKESLSHTGHAAPSNTHVGTNSASVFTKKKKKSKSVRRPKKQDVPAVSSHAVAGTMEGDTSSIAAATTGTVTPPTQGPTPRPAGTTASSLPAMPNMDVTFVGSANANNNTNNNANRPNNNHTGMNTPPSPITSIQNTGAGTATQPNLAPASSLNSTPNTLSHTQLPNPILRPRGPLPLAGPSSHAQPNHQQHPTSLPVDDFIPNYHGGAATTTATTAGHHAVVTPPFHPPPVVPEGHVHPKQHPPPHQHHHHPLPTTDCLRCKDMERNLLSLQADLEYLRTMALKNEFVCSECEHTHQHTTSSSASVTSGKHSLSSSRRSRRKKEPKLLFDSSTGGGTSSGGGGSSVSSRMHKHQRLESLSLKESSQMFIDVTARHKRQIEHMAKDTARWNNDMNLKLSKFSMMCKDLNDESAKRKEESNAVTSELLTVKKERDTMSSELEILRARVQLYEKQELENAEIRKMLRQEENETLDVADEAIKKRDAIIWDLSTRLQQAMDTLERERHQQRQRRQIIFPSNNNRSNSMTHGYTMSTRDISINSNEGGDSSDDLDGMKNDSTTTTRI